MLGAHRLLGGGPPRAPWLAPLPTVVRPDADARHRRPAAGPPVVGLVDEPDLQRVTPLPWSPSDGPWLLAGGPGSGRTTALRALVLAAAARSGPEALHLHVIDAHGSLADLAALPHLGTRTGPDDARACAALVAAPARRGRLDVSPRRRPRRVRRVEGRPTTLVVVDGWDQLVEAQPAHRPDELTGELLRVLRDGRSVGVVGAVSGGRSLLHPRWGGVAGRTFLLGSIDPLDAALAGLRSTDLPRDPPPGRAVRVHDRREVQFAVVSGDDTSAVAPAPGRDPRSARPGDASPSRRWCAGTTSRLLPASAAEPGRDRHRTGCCSASAATNGAPCRWRPDTDGRRLLVAGPSRSGRTNALRVVAESLGAPGRPVAVVADCDAARRMPWPAGLAVVDPRDTDQLVRLRRRHPDLAVLVDDADRLDDTPLTAVLREIAGLVDRDDGLLVVADLVGSPCPRGSAGSTSSWRGTAAGCCSTRPAPTATCSARRCRTASPGCRAAGCSSRTARPPRCRCCWPTAQSGASRPGSTSVSGSRATQAAPMATSATTITTQPTTTRLPWTRLSPTGSRIAFQTMVGVRGHDAAPSQPRARTPSPTAATQDQQGRHQHPGGVAALAQDELDHVEDGEAGQGQRLQPGEQRGEAAGAA